MQASVVVFSWQPPLALNLKIYHKKETAARHSSDKVGKNNENLSTLNMTQSGACFFNSTLDIGLENVATISSVEKQKKLQRRVTGPRS